VPLRAILDQGAYHSDTQDWSSEMNRSLAKERSLVHLLTRREMLGFMSTAAVTIFGCGRNPSGFRDLITGQDPQPIALAAAASVPPCVVRPEQTEGPYFIDEKLNRSDIRSDPSDGSMRPGVPLRLAFQVSRVEGRSCAPLSGARVNIWQCDALGVYSDVRDMNADTRGKTFLRGYQVTSADGTTEFLTIYPGWYPGRAVHIHFKIRAASSSQRGLEFTSQLYFDESLTDQIHKQVPYSKKGYRTTTNDKDFIIPPLTKDAEGYAAKFEIGLQLT
jgi:protocatechuate 3,4-dioxygenase beta subunit